VTLRGKKLNEYLLIVCAGAAALLPARAHLPVMLFWLTRARGCLRETNIAAVLMWASK